MKPSNKRRFVRSKIKLGLPDLEQAKAGVLRSLSSAGSRAANRTLGGHELIINLPPRGNGELILARNSAKAGVNPTLHYKIRPIKSYGGISVKHVPRRKTALVTGSTKLIQIVERILKGA